ncbi:uncharacterized protein N0V89_012052 [Didymosphaeria variabile]|uniref:HET-domain-containing protein n=1 Tax=Didymosphaeria variabile TaxID=1932322 RepID=A0A9W9C5A7_9PLEO|nr:uncharacterized protein N0V89_012052 [Didymosphaeria variabile]KAJ4345916.1 hypothetical protein N0V89_012052 [Didymosphaeria variabile]
MRLLERKDDGGIRLTEFFGDAIPRYAILSHTWGADSDEVTFKDFIEGIAIAKAGYRKIQFCADQAAHDHLRYFWVDTCCIDKSSSAELSEAINSMFAWYRNSARCYVYLSDVPTLAFKESRWFTRGWTLQELLAPDSVEFFSKEGQQLGDKRSMVKEIHEITSISVDVLHGRPLSQLSIDERMSWAAKRQTKREEDAAYSLLGIFDVHIPLIYGEGQRKAFARLQKEISQDSSGQRLAGGTTSLQFGYQPTQGQSFSNVPFAPDRDFVDRPDILAWVHDMCGQPGARAALVGLSGIGKSQLAIQFAHHIYNTLPRPFVFWVHASTRAYFEEGYQGIADRLELPGRLEPKADILQLVSNWLCDEKNGQWVLVLDSADDKEIFFPSQQQGQENVPASLAAYLPQRGSILITSCNEEAAASLSGGHQYIMKVQAMDENQGLQLLRKKLRRNKLQATSQEEGAAKALLRALDYIPLAITQAAAYINRQARMTVPDCLDEFRASDRKRKSLLHYDAGDLRRNNASNSVLTTLQMSFERIRQERPSAAELLSLISFFNPCGIPEEVLRRHKIVLRRDGSVIAKAGAPNDRSKFDSSFNEDLNVLHAYSLVTMTSNDETFEMHALVQFCMRVWLSSSNDADRWQGRFIQLMAQEFPSGDFETWTKCKQLLPHIETLYDAEPDADDMVEKWAQVLTNAAKYLCNRGSYHTAQMVATIAVTAQERVLGLDDEATLRCFSLLARVLQYQGKYVEAEKLHR